MEKDYFVIYPLKGKYSIFSSPREPLQDIVDLINRNNYNFESETYPKFTDKERKFIGNCGKGIGCRESLVGCIADVIKMLNGYLQVEGLYPHYTLYNNVVIRTPNITFPIEKLFNNNFLKDDQYVYYFTSSTEFSLAKTSLIFFYLDRGKNFNIQSENDTIISTLQFAKEYNSYNTVFFTAFGYYLHINGFYLPWGENSSGIASALQNSIDGYSKQFVTFINKFRPHIVGFENITMRNGDSLQNYLDIREFVSKKRGF